MSGQRSKTTLGIDCSEATDNIKAKIQDEGLLPWILNYQMQLTLSRQRSKTRYYHLLNLQMQLTMSRQGSRTRNYYPRHWVFGCTQKCQNKDPRAAIITIEVQSLDATNNVKAKILLQWQTSWLFLPSQPLPQPFHSWRFPVWLWLLLGHSAGAEWQ
jgi:hypothetical protein